MKVGGCGRGQLKGKGKLRGGKAEDRHKTATVEHEELAIAKDSMGDFWTLSNMYI